MSALQIVPADPREPDITALLTTHLDFSNVHSPPEHVHALDIAGLLDPRVTFLSARDGAVLLGVGAIRELSSDHGEIKSMHTAAAARGRGVGRAMLDHLLAIARERGYSLVSLETGTMEAYAAARSLYESAGFKVTPPFGDYWENDYSVCMSLELTTA
jgi:putative acetyltransferase